MSHLKTHIKEKCVKRYVLLVLKQLLFNIRKYLLSSLVDIDQTG